MGGAFDVISIQLADVYLTNTQNNTVTFVGTHMDNSTTTVYVTLTNPTQLTTYNLGIYGIKSLEWDTGNINWTQFDNIMLVPEPATAAILSLGLLPLLRKRFIKK